MKKTLLFAIPLLLGFTAISSADNFVVFGTRADQNPTDIIDWSQLGPDGTVLATPQTVSTFDGNTATVGNINSADFIRADQFTGLWQGNFDFGENLIWTGNPAYGPQGPGPLFLQLDQAVGSFGFEIQADLGGSFTADVSAYDSSNNLLFDQGFTGFSDGSSNGSALFIGLGDTSGVNISRIVISTDSGDPAFANDFAIDDPSFTYEAATPEPRSMAVLLSGLLAAAGAFRRFRNRK